MTSTILAAEALALSTAHTLAMARSDIHIAVNADDTHRRRQYALSARDNAVTVLIEPTSQPGEREHAEYYLADAEAIIATTAPTE
jgi:hypothetical protein